MPEASNDDLLARLASEGHSAGEDPWAAVAASKPRHATVEGKEPASPKDKKLDRMIDRLHGLSNPPPDADALSAIDKPAHATDEDETFVPLEPVSFAEAGLTTSVVEGLVLKLLLSRGDTTGRQISDHLRMPFGLIDELVREMKADQLVIHRGSAPMNDFVYQLPDLGRERARRLTEHCTYFGAAPVALKDYVAAVAKQSLTKQHPTVENLKEAFSDLLINPKMLRRLGPAINSGRGLFLFGAPGNGKTSIAERVTKAFGQHIWIPRALGIDGEVIRLYDPNAHEELPLESDGSLLDERRIDHRWIRIRRPTIVVGGELTMANLEVTLNTSTGISEAPMQLKSNCGTLVIDDFGRQRMSTDELLNRWIVPLEKRYDYLSLANGKKIEVPFDQLVIFSTNLEPRDLVDDAFLRRIPYKIEVTDPSEEEFRELFRLMAPKLGFENNDDVITYLIETHYKQTGRPMRCCHPRDLLTQAYNLALYEGREQDLTNDSMDFAVENYFAVL